MTLSSYDVFQQSRQLPGFQTSMLGQILTNETDPLFSWQYNEVLFLITFCRIRMLTCVFYSYPYPNGCVEEFSAARGYQLCANPNATVTKREPDGHLH
jgi:hypothetical protein